MPRDLADVLHYFIPELGPDSAQADAIPEREPATRPGTAASLAALPLLAVPIGDRDVVRAAFLWNLGVELARLGASPVVVAPASATDASLWPCPGVGPLGVEVILAPVQGLGELYRVALDVAVERAASADPQAGGAVLVRVPPTWLRQPGDGVGLLRWALLFSSDDPAELRETYGLTKLVMAAHPDERGARVGVTLHGIRQVDDARRAFERLARTTESHLGRRLTSYGALMDDLHVYRAIVARRPIGLEHPQSSAARALHDVAGMLLDDALERVGA